MPDIFVTDSKDKDKKTLKEEAGVAKKAHEVSIIHDENHIHALASFCTNPLNISFQRQEPDEKILLFLRRHFATNLPWLIITFILSITPLILGILGFSIFSVFNISLPLTFITSLLIFYYLIVFSYAFVNFIDWFYNVTIITDNKIVDIDFHGLLYHNVAITKLSKIEDVNYTKSGFLRSLFNYGDVYAQTAGAAFDHFDILAVPEPERVAHMLADLIGGPNA